MTNDKLTLYDFQAATFISGVEHSIELLRKYADPASVAVARHLESDLNDLKRDLNFEKPHDARAAGLQSIMHTVNPDGTVRKYRFGMTKPALTNVGYIMKRAAREAAEKARQVASSGKLKVA